MNTTELKDLIEKGINGATALVESDDNVHFNAVIISDIFEKVFSKVKQQQIVYQVIQEHITSGDVHAIAMKTYTPEKWRTLNQKT